MESQPVALKGLQIPRGYKKEMEDTVDGKIDTEASGQAGEERL